MRNGLVELKISFQMNPTMSRSEKNPQEHIFIHISWSRSGISTVFNAKVLGIYFHDKFSEDYEH